MRFATICLLGGLCALPTAGIAQFRELPPPPAYVLQNVTVVHPDGRVETGTDIVVRRGLIESMGGTIEIPGDALLLEGDSLWIYPGIVDAHGAADVAFPEIERSDSVRSWHAPRDIQGFLAHRRVADYLDEEGAAANEQRAKGIVASGILPRGGMAAGLGAAILHRRGVTRAWQLVVNDNIGLAMAFEGGQGVYPATLFGVIAYLRQSFEDAKRDALVRQVHADHPGTIGLPGFDPDYAVLQRAMAGEILVFFAANGAEDIRRVLDLADEYGFSPVVVGGHEAWRVADELARRDIPVIVDGDFPEPDEWEPDEPESDSVVQAKPLEPGAAREKKRIEDIRSNAGRLAAAGVRFAIASGNGDGDILEATRLSIEYGLSPDVALRAITAVPSDLLGIGPVARLEPGSPATFIAATGPLFEDDVEIAHTFVEGGYEEGNGGSGGDAPTVNVTGDWTFTMTSGEMEFELESTLTMDPDGTFRGSVANAQFGTAPMRGRVSGASMNFTITISFGGQSIELSGRGSVEGDRISGNGESQFGAFTMTGERDPGGAG